MSAASPPLHSTLNVANISGRNLCQYKLSDHNARAYAGVLLRHGHYTCLSAAAGFFHTASTVCIFAHQRAAAQRRRRMAPDRIVFISHTDRRRRRRRRQRLQQNRSCWFLTNCPPQTRPPTPTARNPNSARRQPNPTAQQQPRL